MERAEEAPETVLIGKEPHVIDEWQEMPSIWDEVRRTIDERANTPGQFILTGSTRLKIEPEKRILARKYIIVEQVVLNE